MTIRDFKSDFFQAFNIARKICQNWDFKDVEKDWIKKKFWIFEKIKLKKIQESTSMFFNFVEHFFVILNILCKKTVSDCP